MVYFYLLRSGLDILSHDVFNIMDLMSVSLNRINTFNLSQANIASIRSVDPLVFQNEISTPCQTVET